MSAARLTLGNSAKEDTEMSAAKLLQAFAIAALLASPLQGLGSGPGYGLVQALAAGLRKMAGELDDEPRKAAR